jgi:hypothetical protein
MHSMRRAGEATYPSHPTLQHTPNDQEHPLPGNTTRMLSTNTYLLRLCLVHGQGSPELLETLHDGGAKRSKALVDLE